MTRQHALVIGTIDEHNVLRDGDDSVQLMPDWADALRGLSATDAFDHHPAHSLLVGLALQGFVLFVPEDAALTDVNVYLHSCDRRLLNSDEWEIANSPLTLGEAAADVFGDSEDALMKLFVFIEHSGATLSNHSVWSE